MPDPSSTPHPPSPSLQLTFPRTGRSWQGGARDVGYAATAPISTLRAPTKELENVYKMCSEYWNNMQWSVCGWKRGLRRWVDNGRFASQMRIYFTNDCQFSCLFFLPPNPNCMLRKFNHQIFLHITFVRRGWGVGWWWWMEEVKEGVGEVQCSVLGCQ